MQDIVPQRINRRGARNWNEVNRNIEGLNTDNNVEEAIISKDDLEVFIAVKYQQREIIQQ